MAQNRLFSRLHKLTVREVQNAKDGEHGDGGGLILRISQNSEKWVFRYTGPTGKRRAMGLGTVYRQNSEIAGRSLTEARRAAAEARDMLAAGIDPIDHRDGAKAEAKAAEQAKKAETKQEAATLARVAPVRHAGELLTEGP